MLHRRAPVGVPAARRYRRPALARSSVRSSSVRGPNTKAGRSRFSEAPGVGGASRSRARRPWECPSPSGSPIRPVRSRTSAYVCSDVQEEGSPRSGPRRGYRGGAGLPSISCPRAQALASRRRAGSAACHRDPAPSGPIDHDGRPETALWARRTARSAVEHPFDVFRDGRFGCVALRGRDATRPPAPGGWTRVRRPRRAGRGRGSG